MALSVRQNSTFYLLFLIFFFNGLGVNSFNTTDFSLILISAVGFYHITFIKKEKIDNIFFYIIFYWIIVNYFAWLCLGGEFKLTTFIGSILKLFIGYSFLKIFKEYFIFWFEKTVFILAIISIPLFILQLLDPKIFYSIPFNFIESSRIGEWNGIVFTYAPLAHSFRNAGFAGEPGTFGYYIGLAMIFNIILNRGKPNLKLLIFILIGLTTFSTNFYVSLLFFACFFIYRSNLNIKIWSLFIFIPLIFIIFQLPFVGKKIEDFIIETEVLNQNRLIKDIRVNRIATFFNNMSDVLKYPFGYGISKVNLKENVYGNPIDGTNDISRIAIRFGIYGFFYFVIIFFKLFKRLSLNMKGHQFFTIITFMYIAANSMERDYFAMGIFWLYFIIQYEDLLNLNREMYIHSKGKSEVSFLNNLNNKFFF